MVVFAQLQNLWTKKHSIFWTMTWKAMRKIWELTGRAGRSQDHGKRNKVSLHPGKKRKRWITQWETQGSLRRWLNNKQSTSPLKICIKLLFNQSEELRPGLHLTNCNIVKENLEMTNHKRSQVVMSLSMNWRKTPSLEPISKWHMSRDIKKWWDTREGLLHKQEGLKASNGIFLSSIAPV